MASFFLRYIDVDFFSVHENTKTKKKKKITSGMGNITYKTSLLCSYETRTSLQPSHTNATKLHKKIRQNPTVLLKGASLAG